jgi:hypothetical protein
MGHTVFFPNKRQQPGNHDRDKKQHADHRQRKSDIIRKPDAILAIEEEPGRQREPGDEADRSPINLRVKLIEYWPVMAVSSLLMKTSFWPTEFAVVAKPSGACRPNLATLCAVAATAQSHHRKTQLCPPQVSLNSLRPRGNRAANFSFDCRRITFNGGCHG